AGVGGSDGSLRIGDEHRHAVGRGDRQQHVLPIRPQRVRARPRLRWRVAAHDIPPVHLLHARDAIETERPRERRTIPRLFLEWVARPRQASLGPRREAGDETERSEQRRPQHAVALDPRPAPRFLRRTCGGTRDLAHFGVAYARIAATIPATAPMSQKRIVTFSSAQPISSKWL